MTTVLVTGATGNQGGAVVDHLLAAGEFDVHGLTRDATSDAARALTERGVTMVEGDLNEPESLRTPMDAADAVFLVTNFWTEGYDRQVQQGKNVADVAAEMGVEHVVFSGVGSHWRETGVPHFDSAAEIEAHAREREFSLTVLGPVFFFQNLEAFVESILGGTLALPLAEGVALQMVDVDDIGRVAAEVLARPGAFDGERVELAGDERTLAETADAIASVAGIDVEPSHVPIEDAYEEFGEEFTVMCEWFNEVGYDADIDVLEERFGFAFATLEEYLREHGWTEKEGMATVPGWVKAFQ